MEVPSFNIEGVNLHTHVDKNKILSELYSIQE